MRRLLAATLGLSAVLFAPAQAAGNWEFVVTNASSYAVTSFNTANTNGSWSKNWIGGNAILPGEQFLMDFRTAEGYCVVPTMVTFEDGSYFDVDVDYCASTNLILENDAISAE